MPPAISDDEQSDIDDVAVPVPVSSKRGKTKASSVAVEEEEEPLNTVKGDLDNGHENEGAGEDEDVDEDMEEDEYIVEKILSHIVDPDSTVRYEVKWEGYEKKSDRTWETTENLRENASEVLQEYLRSVGGEDKIIQEARTAIKTKKRGRPSSTTPANGSKKRRNDSHPASATPPVSARAWKPPVGSWEEEIESIDACHDEQTGKLTVYLTWKNGHKTQHDTKVIYQRCPQKMLQFYERHVKIVKTSSDIGQTDD